MLRFKPWTMDQLREQAAAKRQDMDATRAMAEGPPPRPLNVREILDLGALIYFTWRGRTYGVPPLPWKAGAALLDAYLEARNAGESLTRETAAQYYGALGRMAGIMWRSTRSVGRLRRMARRLRLIQNPYRKATEKELADLALFFLGRRMTAHDPIPVPAMTDQMT